jgi:mannose-1-phosphate guanylyltransferase
VVLAGGAGTRFWPASRASLPKQFVPLIAGETLFDTTLARLSELAPPERIRVVSAEPLARVTRRALARWPGVKLMLEPAARNTAAAIAWAAAEVAAEDPDGVMGVFPSDPLIPDVAAHTRCIRSAAGAARSTDELVLVGIRPTRPDTAYGYLRVRAEDRGPARTVRRFVEKPTQQAARRMLRAGGYLWNAGMLVARCERVLAECETHAVELGEELIAALAERASGRRLPRARLARAYAATKPAPFDRAVLERSAHVRAVTGRFHWSDLGSWDAVASELPTSAEAGENRVKAPEGEPPTIIDSSGNLVWNATGRPIALLGVEGLAVIQTGDALLVCSLDRAQDVRQVVEELNRRGRTELT